MHRTNIKVAFFRHFFFSSLKNLAVILIIAGLSGCSIENGQSSELRETVVRTEEETSPEDSETEAEPQTESIYVYVCGEVLAPGVYELPGESRIYEAIDAAGGMKENASETYLNQAEILTDGQQVYVPSKEEQAGEQKISGENRTADDGKVNLNTATKEELMTLSGIGEVKAEAIIRYREERGGFTSVEELKEIEGIKEGVFGKVKDQVKI